MHWFVKEFQEAVVKHCVGQTIVSVYGDGIFKNESAVVFELSNGLFFQCNNGQSGLDGESFYEVHVYSSRQETPYSQENSIVSKSTWDPSGFTRLNEPLIFAKELPAYRIGLKEMVGKTIEGPLVSGHQLGLSLSEGYAFVVVELSGGVISAGYALRREGDIYIPVGKCITNFWSQCTSLYPGFLDDHLKKDDTTC